MHDKQPFSRERGKVPEGRTTRGSACGMERALGVDPHGPGARGQGPLLQEHRFPAPQSLQSADRTLRRSPLWQRGRRDSGRGLGAQAGGPKFAKRTLGLHSTASNKAAEPADKPGSVVDSHSSRRNVTVTLEQPTRTRRGPRHEVPIWSCSRWGLPCRTVTRLAVRSYRTISPLPRASRETVRRYLSVALSVGSRRPGVTWHRALWSPDFPRHPHPPKWTWMTRLPGRLRRAHCLTTDDLPS